MNYKKVYQYAESFAPPIAVMIFQPLLIILGIYLSRSSGLNIPIYFPTIGLLFGISLMGLSTAGLFLIFKEVQLWNQLMDWIFFEHFGKKGFVWTVVTMPLLISLGEEIFFRGFVLQKIGLIGSTIVFAIYHLRKDKKSIYLFWIALILGLGFGEIFLKTRNIIYPIATHFFVLFFGAMFSYKLEVRKRKQIGLM